MDWDFFRQRKFIAYHWIGFSSVYCHKISEPCASMLMATLQRSVFSNGRHDTLNDCQWFSLSFVWYVKRYTSTFLRWKNNRQTCKLICYFTFKIYRFDLKKRKEWSGGHWFVFKFSKGEQNFYKKNVIYSPQKQVYRVRVVMLQQCERIG